MRSLCRAKSGQTDGQAEACMQMEMFLSLIQRIQASCHEYYCGWRDSVAVLYASKDVRCLGCGKRCNVSSSNVVGKLGSRDDRSA